jgi:hypothetical protein
MTAVPQILTDKDKLFRCQGNGGDCGCPFVFADSEHGTLVVTDDYGCAAAFEVAVWQIIAGMETATIAALDPSATGNQNYPNVMVDVSDGQIVLHGLADRTVQMTVLEFQVFARYLLDPGFIGDIAAHGGYTIRGTELATLKAIADEADALDPTTDGPMLVGAGAPATAASGSTHTAGERPTSQLHHG